MDNVGTKKQILEEERLEMPGGGDTKQWLSKLLEAPIMQADKSEMASKWQKCF